MKPKVLVIEIGLRNLTDIKDNLKIKKANLIYASNFMDVVDVLYLQNVHIIMISDFRGIESTICYIKMFKKRDPNYKVVILSCEKNIKKDQNDIYIREGADSFFSCYDIGSLKDHITTRCSNLAKEDVVLNEWKDCTNKTVRFLKNNYSLPKDLMKTLTEEINYSTSSVLHSIKKDTGKSVGDWVRELRVKGAMELLRSTDYTVSFISDQVGYGTLQGFLKAFKKSTGKTPIEFRKEFE